MITERYFSNTIENLTFNWKVKTTALLTVVYLKIKADKKFLSLSLCIFY